MYIIMTMALARNMSVVLILWTLLCSVQQHSHSAAGVFGFMIATTTTTIRSNHRFVIPQQQRHLMMSSAPSDSASLDDESDDFSEQGYTATATDDSFTAATTPTTPEGIVSKLFDLLPTNGLDQPPDDEMRSTMNELMVQLEKTTTTLGGFTSSPLLNGVWELRYVGGYTTPTQNSPFRLSPTRQLALFLYDGGYSPGVFAYTLAQQLPNPLVDTSERSVEITISRSQPRIEASCGVKLFNGAVDGTVKVTANLEVMSNVRFRETYESITIMGQESPFRIPEPLRYRRDLYITYLDDDLLIVRDGTGVPEILVRQSKQFMKDWGIEPNMMDDMVPPGDGDDANF